MDIDSAEPSCSTASIVSPEKTTGEQKDLKPVKTQLLIKKTDVRQCRLCLRVVPRDSARDAAVIGEADISQKIMEAVGVRITATDKVRTVCVNCLLAVDMVHEFQMTCRKADLLHSTKLLMMHPGNWLSEENQDTFQECHKLLKRNRAKMDGLFKCSQIKDGDVKVVAQDKVTLEVTIVQTEEKDPIDAETINRTMTKSRRIQPKVMCDVCGILVPKYSEENHRNQHLGIKPYRCTEEGCETMFHSMHSMNRHVVAVHEKDDQRYECKICHRMLKGIVGLQFHIRSQHSKKAKHPLKTECTICGKLYYKVYIKDHMATHTGDLPYQCEFCDRKFAANNNYLFHRKKYHWEELEATKNNSKRLSQQT